MRGPVEDVAAAARALALAHGQIAPRAVDVLTRRRRHSISRMPLPMNRVIQPAYAVSVRML